MIVVRDVCKAIWYVITETPFVSCVVWWLIVYRMIPTLKIMPDGKIILIRLITVTQALYLAYILVKGHASEGGQVRSNGKSIQEIISGKRALFMRMSLTGIRNYLPRLWKTSLKAYLYLNTMTSRKDLLKIPAKKIPSDF